MGNIEEVLGTSTTDTVIAASAWLEVTVLSLVIALPLAFLHRQAGQALGPAGPHRVGHAATLGRALSREGLRHAGGVRARWLGEAVASSRKRDRMDARLRPAVVLTLTYLWIPYMILPIYAGLKPVALVPARRVR